MPCVLLGMLSRSIWTLVTFDTLLLSRLHHCVTIMPSVPFLP